jgi:transposase
MTGETSTQVMHVMDGNLRAQDNGRKRHIAVDTGGLLLAVVVTPASVQDRDGARPLLWRLRVGHRRVRLAWTDAGYSRKLTDWAAATMHLAIQIVAKRDPHAFQVLPHRWVVERTFAGSASTAAASATTSGSPSTTKPCRQLRQLCRRQRT